MYTMGVDIGSASSKAVILKDGKDVLAAEVVQVGTGSTGPKKAMEMAFEKSGVKEEEIDFIIATGYGRFSLEDADKQMSEISCHAKGIYHLDNKGGIKQFFMNDKCAAGTGRFIEVMARVLETTLDEMATLDEQAEDTAPISSTCTVFAESEVISQLSKGTDRKSIARGVHMSVASRACGLAYRAGLEKDIVFTGGVAKNAGVVRAVSSVLKTDVIVAPNPQTTGALGAALFAYEAATKK